MNNSSIWNKFLSLMTGLGGVGGAIALALIIFKGGAVVKAVESLESWRHDVEIQGTQGFREHKGKDEAEVSELKRRMEKVEAAVMSLSEMRGDVRLANSKLDILSEELRRHEETTMRHFSTTNPGAKESK
jgi:hypothetical protein